MNISQFLPERKEKLELSDITCKFRESGNMYFFNQDSANFLSEVSKQILKNREAASLTEMVALAYFLRKANIEAIKNEFISGISQDQVCVPAGTAFHIAPSNVDTIFMYSWALSLLAGNPNIVRITQTPGYQLELLLSIIGKVMNNSEFNNITGANTVITYPHDEEINAGLSAVADLRIIWGGDDTIRNIRRFPAKTTTRDIVFADKISFAIVNAHEYLLFNEQKTKETARLFYNDAYQFNQMACSSPQVVFFAGDDKINKNASIKFWSALESELKRRNHSDEPSVVINRMVKMFGQVAAGGEFDVKRSSEFQKPTVINIGLNEIENLGIACGGGYFYECFIDSPENLNGIIVQKNQTLTYIGFISSEMKELAANLCGKGLDRLVPVGQALSFMQVWDGYVLLNEFTRRVSVI